MHAAEPGAKGQQPALHCVGAYLALPTTALGAVGSEHLDAVDSHALLSMCKFIDIMDTKREQCWNSENEQFCTRSFGRCLL